MKKLALVSSRLSFFAALVASGACQRPPEEPPKPPLQLKAMSEVRPKTELPMPPSRPSFNWPEGLRLEATGTIEQRAQSDKWSERRATLAFKETLAVTTTSIGPIVTLGDLAVTEERGPAAMLAKTLREVAIEGNLALRVMNDGRLNRVQDPAAIASAAQKTLAAHPVELPEGEPASPALDAAEVETRAKAVWSAWVENALGLVGSAKAGWCGAARPQGLPIETDRPAEACLALTAGSECLVDDKPAQCFLVEYALELGGEDQPDHKIKHESRARVLLEMQTLIPVKVEVWRFSDFTEPREGDTPARTWETRLSTTRFRRLDPLPVGSARAKLRASCEGGVAEDCLELGIMIGTGKDGPPDLADARRWVEKSCALAHQPACDFAQVMADAPPTDGEAAAVPAPTP